VNLPRGGVGEDLGFLTCDGLFGPLPGPGLAQLPRGPQTPVVMIHSGSAVSVSGEARGQKGSLMRRPSLLALALALAVVSVCAAGIQVPAEFFEITASVDGNQTTVRVLSPGRSSR
jgi:hypothetical protein